MPLRWLSHLAGLRAAYTGTSAAERAMLAQLTAGKKVLVEIGTDEGVNAASFRRGMDPAGVLYLVDPYPAGRLGVNFSYLIARREVEQCRNGRVVFLQHRSDDAAAFFSAPIDFLFIDGDHSLEGVTKDWREWAPKVVTGGVVALHDSRVFPGGWTAPDWGPVQLVNQITRGDDLGVGARFAPEPSVDSLSVFRRL